MLVSWLGAAVPIAAVLYLMLGRRLSAGWGGIVGWLVALGVAVVGFGAGPTLLLVAQAKAMLLAAYVLYIIVMALLFYHTVNTAGSIQSFGARLTSLTTDRGLQALLLAWAFGSFLQGVSGYGVPTAIVAPLLVGLGFTPVQSVVMAGLGHAWAVTFGSLGASFEALLAVSRHTAAVLAPAVAGLMGITCFGCGCVVLWAVDGLHGIRRGLGCLLATGLTMAGVQFVLAVSGLYPFAAIGAGLAGMLVTTALARWRRPAPAAPPAPPSGEGSRLAWLPYVLLVGIISCAEFIGPVNRLLNTLVLRLEFPEVRTALGYVTPAETGRTLSVFGHPGALLAIAVLLIYGIFRWRGALAANAGQIILRKTTRGSVVPAIGITSMVAMAVTMEHAGMTHLLAEGLGLATRAAFPLVSPLIGALGAFMTGSNTNSNVIFGALQQDTAHFLALPEAIILAAQTTGGALGGAFAPAKVIVGCSTVGLAGKEAAALKGTMVYGLILLLITGLVTLAAAWH